MNEDIKEYFDTLPTWLQENILQSGVKFGSKKDLEDIARNFGVAGKSGDR